jgi:antitoxin PrlF
MKYSSGKVSNKGIVVIPIEVRRQLAIDEGDKLEFVLNEGGGASMYVVKRKSVLDVFGVLETDKSIPDMNELRDSFKEEAARGIVHRGKNS